MHFDIAPSPVSSFVFPLQWLAIFFSNDKVERWILAIESRGVYAQELHTSTAFFFIEGYLYHQSEKFTFGDNNFPGISHLLKFYNSMPLFVVELLAALTDRIYFIPLGEI